MVETDFKDNFYEDKFNFLMGYVSEVSEQISEKDILDFHLSHRTISNFEYEPTKKTPKIIWKYLSSSNLLENIDNVDLGDLEKISLIARINPVIKSIISTVFKNLVILNTLLFL